MLRLLSITLALTIISGPALAECMPNCIYLDELDDIVEHSPIAAGSLDNLLCHPDGSAVEFDGVDESTLGYVIVDFDGVLYDRSGDDFIVYLMDWHPDDLGPGQGEEFSVWGSLTCCEPGNFTKIADSGTPTGLPQHPHAASFDLAGQSIRYLMIRNEVLLLGGYPGPDLDAVRLLATFIDEVEDIVDRSPIAAGTLDNLLCAPDGSNVEFDGVDAETLGYVIVDFERMVHDGPGDDFVVHVRDWHPDDLGPGQGEEFSVWGSLTCCELEDFTKIADSGTPTGAPHEMHQVPFDLGGQTIRYLMIRNEVLLFGGYPGPDLDAVELLSDAGTGLPGLSRWGLAGAALLFVVAALGLGWRRAKRE